MGTAATRLKRIEAVHRTRETAAFLAFGLRKLGDEFGVTMDELRATIAENRDEMRRAGFDPDSEADMRRWCGREGLDWDELVAEGERVAADFAAWRADRPAPRRRVF